MTDPQKNPLVRSLNDFATARVKSAVQLLGKALPCSIVSRDGQIVTVSFDVSAPPFTLPNVTIPIASSLYDWVPLQPGDAGVVMPADAYLGGVSGLGGGTASLVRQANLTPLVFLPVSNVAWMPPGGDTDKRAVQGPKGVYLQDDPGKATGVFDTDNGIVFKFGDGTITMTKDGITLKFGDDAASVVVIDKNGVTISGRVFLDHVHSGIQPGPDDTGPVV